MTYTDEIICLKLDRIIELLTSVNALLSANTPPANSGKSVISEHGKKNVLLSTKQAAEYLGMTIRFLESKRITGGGPPYVRISSKAVRYQESALREWSEERIVMNTSQLADLGRQR